MKFIFVSLGLLLCAFILTGCVTQVPAGYAIKSIKSTCFGLDFSADPMTMSPHMRLGLIRYYYQVIPVSTNEMFAAPYDSYVDASLRLSGQTVVEKYSTTSSNSFQALLNTNVPTNIAIYGTNVAPPVVSTNAP